MKTENKSRNAWHLRSSSFELTKTIARVLFHDRFLLVALSFGLLALPSAVTALSDARGQMNGRVATPIRAIAAPHEAPVVTNTSDTGPGSLRQALADAQDGDVITFDISSASSQKVSSSVSMINLTNGELVIDKDITISGPGANALEITRDGAAAPFRIFHVNAGHTVTIRGLTIGNGLATAGGGIYNDHSSLTVDSCALTGNSALGQTYGGGGIYNDGANGGNATLLVSNTLLRGNSAPNGFGGGIATDVLNGGSATLSVVNSTLSGNSASLRGGGAIDQDGGGGNASLMIASSTLCDNSGAAGIYSIVSVLRIGNTILKAGSAGPNIFNSGGSATSAGYNLSNDSGGGVLNATGDQLYTNPMLGPLKDNGGPTLSYAPLVNSPAIDQGRSDTIPTLTVVSDQRAFARPVDDPLVPNPNSGDGSDIGAVELSIGLHPSNAASWKTHGDAGDFPITLPHAGLGIESRSGGANDDYKVIVNFAQPVTFSGAAVTSGIGQVSTINMTGAAGTQLTVNLTGVTNAQTIVVALFDVDDGTKHSDVGIRMGVLVGDTTGNGTVNASDVSLVKMQSGQPVGADNFRADVVANGAINASDVSAAKFQSGTALP